MSDSDCDIKTEPLSPKLEICEESLDGALPPNSKDLYEKTYQKFLQWYSKQNVTSMSEPVLLAYFEHLSKSFKPSSLWTSYSMLRTTINLKNNVNIENYKKLKSFLKKKSEGFKPKKSKILTPHEINQFLTNAPNSKYLLQKVLAIMGICGGCNSQELKDLKLSDVMDTGSRFIVQITTKNKTERAFIVGGKLYPICKQYANLRSAHNTESLQFFLKLQNEKIYNQNVGIHKITSTPMEIAKFLKLADPHLYTGHCFRRSSAKILVTTEGDFNFKKYVEGKSFPAAADCKDESFTEEEESKPLNILSSIKMESEDQSDFSQIDQSDDNKSSIDKVDNTTLNVPNTQMNVLQKPSTFVFNNCENLTLNFQFN